MLLQMALLHSFLWLSSVPLWRKKWQPTPGLLPGKFHGRRSLVGYSPWGPKESDTTEGLQCQCQCLLLGVAYFF